MVAPALDVLELAPGRDRLLNGLSSSSDSPVVRSTYSRSSTDILSTGTAILMPFVLWRLILPSFRPKNWASTLNVFERSVQVRTFLESGSIQVSNIH